MKNFTMSKTKSLIDKAMKQEPLPNDWLNSRYQMESIRQGGLNPYYKLFYYLSQELEPAFVVELGSYQATAAAHFAGGNSDTFVVTIDIHKDDPEAKRLTIEAAEKFENLQYLNDWTWNAIRDVKAYNKQIDILFIDSWHVYEYAIKDWEYYSPLLSDGALVIVDDIMNSGPSIVDIDKFWDELPLEHKFIETRLHRGVPMGFGIYGPTKTKTTNRKSKRTTTKS